MKRYLFSQTLRDLPKKIVLLTGPRQCGKTTLSKQLYPDYDYFNYDSIEDRMALEKKTWDRKKTLVIFDELHKKKYWKRWLKGIYDTEGIPPQILVTGSAKLDVIKKVGDSLAGRYFQLRLHPLDLKEAKQYSDFSEEEIFERLWQCSGFPEPFLSGNKTDYLRWRRSHLDIILRQDLIDLYSIRDIQAIENLVLLLKERVGAPVSYANLARDLERDAKTIKRWLELLKSLYVIFSVTPYYKKLARSLLKEPKYYFYDHAFIDNDDGAHLENLVASALLKECHFIEDTKGIKTNLHYLRTKDGKELDFAICFERQPTYLIEIKKTDMKPAAGFKYFEKFFPKANLIQLVKDCSRESTYPNGLEIRSLIPWLTQFNLQKDDE